MLPFCILKFGWSWIYIFALEIIPFSNSSNIVAVLPLQVMKKKNFSVLQKYGNRALALPKEVITQHLANRIPDKNQDNS